MSNKKTSTTPPSTSPSSEDSNPVKFNSALTKAKAIAEKLKSKSNDNKEHNLDSIPTHSPSGSCL